METPRIGSLRSTLDGGAVSLRWTEWGPATGKPVVCVHGLTRKVHVRGAALHDPACLGRQTAGAIGILGILLDAL